MDNQSEKNLVACRFLLKGHVQGCGMRPALCRLAERLQLAGTVKNTSQGTEIEVEGPSERIATFQEAIITGDVLPKGCSIEEIACWQVPLKQRSGVQVEHEPAIGPIATAIPADVAVCLSCLTDSLAQTNRRHGYALTTCADCGPRFSLIQAMPFERQHTTMTSFPLCYECLAEYQSSQDRRFHAQTMGCPRCGPEVWAEFGDGSDALVGTAAIENIGWAIKRGGIVALRGVGGYQLLADATNQQAVTDLRERKHRPAKPLAIMVASLAAAEELAYLCDAERASLAGPANPIVLTRAKGQLLAAGVYPNLKEVGLMLPTTPLHAMLLRECGRPLVCTSGNREGEPLEYEIDSARRNLNDMCDAWLHHNRSIAQPIDDSVVRIIAGRPVTLRLARGMAPLRLNLAAEESSLAAGGHLKSALAWNNGAQAVLGPHIGNPDTLAARRRFVQTFERMQQLYEFTPQRVVHDQHPEYFSTAWAESLGCPAVSVQHHHAHVVAGMLEHKWLTREVLGVAWDGTGYGNDGSIWGSEFLVATVAGYHRVGHLLPFRLPGGDSAVREPWRVAATLMQAALGRLAGQQHAWRTVKPNELSNLLQLATGSTRAPVCTSAGRLFDAAACLILGIERSSYEAETAMRLEAAADRNAERAYRLEVTEHNGTCQLDWRPLIRELLADRNAGTSPEKMAMRFHRSLAVGIAAVCRRHAALPIVLCGGVFQNRLLTELLAEELADREMGLPGVIPPGDGGLAAGQLAIALNQRG